MSDVKEVSAEQRCFEEIYDAMKTVTNGAYIFIIDFKTGEMRASENLMLELGIPRHEYSDYREGLAAWRGRIHPDDLALYDASIKTIMEGKERLHDLQYRMLHRDGKYTVVTCRGAMVHDLDGRVRYFSGTITNHGNQRHTDALTALRNQYGFFVDIDALIAKKAQATIQLVGIQRISEINNLYGYSYGNRVIQTFARRLKDFMKGKGEVYRMDGATFAVVSTQLTPEEVRDRYLELHEEGKAGITVDGRKMPMALKSSFISLDDEALNSRAVYSCLFYAYGLSKNLYFGNLVRYEEVAGRDGRNSLAKVSHIREAIVDDCRGFYLVYQPVVDCETEKVEGAEALIRWSGDPYGIVPPNDFIPVLEEDSTYQQLGHWILRQAMTDGLEMIKVKPDFVLNVNLSYSQMENPNFLNELKNLLVQTGYPTRNLCLELTERCRHIAINQLFALVSDIRALGVQMALDDFGTGYSSLNILNNVPIDCVKIDREFVKDLLADPGTQNFIHRLTDFLGIYSDKICVEGVETAEMRNFLRGCNVKMLQGYHYSKPIELEPFLDYVRAHS